MSENWIADRMHLFDSSGIRRVFDLGSKLTDPINLSIGQPDFDAPEAARDAACAAIKEQKNGYSLTQGSQVLLDKLAAQVASKYDQADREVFVTSGTSGGLVLALLAVINPGDEVIVFDPFFVMYNALVEVAGGKVVYVSFNDDFTLNSEALEAAITDKTKAILFNSPANPTGVVATEAEVKLLAEIAKRHDLFLLSDEIYNQFSYDAPFISPAKYYEKTLVVDGFSKGAGMPGWRVGFAHGPSAIVHQMLKLQQYTFVCAPHPLQIGAAAALDCDTTEHIAAYRRKRDLIYDGLSDVYDFVKPSGAFYAFPRLPEGMNGDTFVEKAIENNLLVIPGKIFSRSDTHFRISYAANDEMLERGIDVLRKIAKQ